MNAKNSLAGFGIILLFLHCVSATMSAQPGWNKQTSGTTQNLHDVFLVDSTLAVAVGENGTLLRTVNGGITWNAESSGTSNNLHGVTFANRDTGIAVGGHSAVDFSYATILRTTDGGMHWTNLFGDTSSTPFGYFLHDVTFLNETTVVAVGGNPIFFGQIFGILRSTNAGATWQLASFGETASLLACSFTDQVNGIAVGTNRLIIKTTNGGQAWSIVSGGGSGMSYRGVYYAPPLTIIVGDSAAILRTTDGGTNWSTQQDESGATLNGITFPDISTGFIVNSIGGIIKTIDQGNSWSVLASTTNKTLRNAFFADTQVGAVVGDSGTILRTTYGGEETDLTVTFRVQMGVQLFKKSFRPDLGDAVSVRFQANGGGNLIDTLHDNDSDSIYASTAVVKSHAVIEYRFWKTLRDGVDSERIGSNRVDILGGSDTTLPLAYFSDDALYPSVVAYDAGWDMISLPRVVADPSANTLFPTANSSVFAFEGSSYVPKDSLKKGVGYWIRFSATAEGYFSGQAITSDTIDVGEGWNLIGTLTDTLTTANDIVSDPPGIIVSSFFGFTLSSYSVATVLEPGKAYWVKVSQAGKLILTSLSSFGR